ncbi:glycosyltransferase family 2 protein [bacterium]|nr:glycosyltransferase family 2 protein [bacterium]
MSGQEHIQTLSLVVPIYNEAQSLQELHRRISEVFPEPDSRLLEIIYIDDGSTDEGLQILKGLQQNDARIRILSFRKNMGKTIALSQAFKVCSGQIIATLDADLQNDPADIPTMIKLLEQGSDFVNGWRKKRFDHLTKTVPSCVINSIIRLISGLTLRDINCGLKVFKSEILKTLKLYGKQHRYIPLKAAFAGYTVTEYVVQHHPRRYGHSKYGFLRFPEGIFDLITVLFMGKFERSPFYLFGGIGTALFLVGSIILTYLSIGWFMGKWIASRPLFSLALLLVIFGFQLLSLGLLAELMLNLSRPDYDVPYEEVRPHPLAVNTDRPDRN